jgi:hypothetical protein
MVEIRKEIYKIDKGKYGFKIYVDGQLRVIQEFKPNVEGWHPMTEEEANTEADKIIEAIKTTITQQT